MLEIHKFNKFIIGNWKLNGSFSFSEEYFKNLKIDNFSHDNKCIVICPPLPFISKITDDRIHLGAQNCSYFNNGAYTGEISAEMIKEMGCKFIILGHSERRSIFKESDETIQRKIINALEADLIPIFCFGENLAQKKENLTRAVLKDQIKKAIPSNLDINSIIFAYEPIWSIGTGLLPKIDEIAAIHLYIKNELLNNSNAKVIYGGSVKASNYKKIIEENAVDGLLVGGASINLDEFNQILNF